MRKFMANSFLSGRIWHFRYCITGPPFPQAEEGAISLIEGRDGKGRGATRHRPAKPAEQSGASRHCLPKGIPVEGEKPEWGCGSTRRTEERGSGRLLPHLQKLWDGGSCCAAVFRPKGEAGRPSAASFPRRRFGRGVPAVKGGGKEGWAVDIPLQGR